VWVTRTIASVGASIGAGSLLDADVSGTVENGSAWDPLPAHVTKGRGSILRTQSAPTADSYSEIGSPSLRVKNVASAGPLTLCQTLNSAGISAAMGSKKAAASATGARCSGGRLRTRTPGSVLGHPGQLPDPVAGAEAEPVVEDDGDDDQRARGEDVLDVEADNGGHDGDDGDDADRGEHRESDLRRGGRVAVEEEPKHESRQDRDEHDPEMMVCDSCAKVTEICSPASATIHAGITSGAAIVVTVVIVTDNATSPRPR